MSSGNSWIVPRTMDGMLATSEAEKKRQQSQQLIFSRRQTLTIFGMEFNKKLEEVNSPTVDLLSKSASDLHLLLRYHLHLDTFVF